MMGLLNISEGSTIGLHAALYLAKRPGESVTTACAAEALQVSAAHLSKVFQRLARSGLLKAVRGPKGGYSLDRPLTDIRLRDVFEAIEGPMKLRDCLMTRPCAKQDECLLGDMLRDINKLVAQHFDKRLSELCPCEGAE